MKTKIMTMVGTVCCLLFLSASAWAYVVLPNPDDPYVAVIYDDFYSYVPEVLTQLGYTGFKDSTGQGKLDLLLWVGNMQNDQEVEGYIFPKAISEPNNAVDATGIWSVSVDNLVEFLDAIYDSTIPVFAYDLNQTGNSFEDTSVLATAKFYVKNAAGEVIALWSLDGNNNTGDINDDPTFNQHDPAALVLAPPRITFTTVNGTSVDVTGLNKGSGSGDFVGYAPTMDLSLYTGIGNMFYFEPFFYGLNNGPENVWISGALRPFSTPVPEPSTMLLLGIGVSALAFVGRKVRK